MGQGVKKMTKNFMKWAKNHEEGLRGCTKTAKKKNKQNLTNGRRTTRRTRPRH